VPRQYDHPPLIEAVCEYRFNSDAWDWTLPGLIFQEVGQEFCKKREVAAALRFGHPAGPRIDAGLAKMQFLREDESALLQLSPNTLAINHVAVYPGWEKVKAELLEQLDIYREIANPASLKRIGLRYINRIVVDLDHIDVTRHFVTFPGYPKLSEEALLDSLNVQASLRFSSPPVQLNFTLTDRAVSQAGSVSDAKTYIFDLDAFAADGEVPELDDVASWLESAHKRLEDFFDASFSDEVHEQLFGEIKC
jgi:uncharacterized protein (TIGR04255 family)